MKSWNNLCGEFISDENIKISILNSAKGKKKKRKDVLKMLQDIDKSVEIIKNYANNYKNDKHKHVEIYDGISRKKRTIIVPTYRELIVQHMIVNCLKPMFLQGLYEYSYGSIPNRGAHDAKKVIEKWIRKDSKNCKYVLKLDIKKYFDSIPHNVLKEKLSKCIKDKNIICILFKIIDATEKGIPLGYYTSQWISMWYLKDFDHFVKEQCYSPHYMRYADDIVIFGANKRKLWNTYDSIVKYLGNLGLALNNRSQLFRFIYTKNGKDYGRDLDFMGYRFFRNKTILRRSIFYKMMRKARKIYKKDKPSIYELRQMMSYLGYIKSSDVYGAYLKYIKPFFDFKKAKRRISSYDRRVLKNVENSSIVRTAS